jgi:hypothetical protein
MNNIKIKPVYDLKYWFWSIFIPKLFYIFLAKLPKPEMFETNIIKIGHMLQAVPMHTMK